MRPGNSISNKIQSREQLIKTVAQWRIVTKAIVFTNGCFDILHAGHIASLQQAASEGDYLVVGLNSDSSVKGLKGKNRPVNDEQSRALVMASLAFVDAVCIFSEPTPLELITSIRPDVMVKGGDYKVEEIAGSKEVISWGGRVVINPILEGFSTTAIIERMK